MNYVNFFNLQNQYNDYSNNFNRRLKMDNHAMDDHNVWCNLRTAILVLVVVNLLIYMVNYIA